MLLRKSLYKLIIFLSLGVSAGCYSKSSIELQNGLSVDNCSDYNEARKDSKIKEGSRNFSIASEYLDCSILPGLEPIVEANEILRLINSALRIRSIPTSLGMSVGRKDTFKVLDPNLNFDTHALEIVSEERNFKIFLKGRLQDKVLIWIVDEIPKGTYRSYYPALLIISVDEGTVLASPFYESGFI